MREALENAEKKAREEKSRESHKHVLESVGDNYIVSTITDTNENSHWFNSNSAAEISAVDNTSSKTQNTKQVKDSVISLCNDATVSLNSFNIVPTQNEGVLKMHDGTQTGMEIHKEALLIAAETVAMPADRIAVMLGKTTEGRPHDIIPTPGGGVQLALLMSPSLQPLMLDDKVVTPSKYRGMGHEKGTQTDTELITGSRGRWGKGKADTRITRKERKK